MRVAWWIVVLLLITLAEAKVTILPLFLSFPTFSWLLPPFPVLELNEAR